MEAQEVLEQTQVELAEGQQDATLPGDSSESPPTIGEAKLKGRIGFVVTYGWRWTELRGIACLFTPPLLLRRILFVFVFLFVFGYFCYPQQRSSAECCVGREFQDPLLLVSNKLFGKLLVLWRMLSLEDRPTNIFVASINGPSGPIFQIRQIGLNLQIWRVANI